MTYRIFHAATLSDMENRVNAAIQEGWSPLGGIGSNAGLWAQAMTRDEPLVVAKPLAAFALVEAH